MSLADIYDDWLVTNAIEKKRDPLRLFVTDVGKCPRQVALRMTRAERRAETAQQRMMWDLARYIEETLMFALDHAGQLLEYQAPVDISDRENWGGRLDIVRKVDGKVQIVEVKTERSNALKRRKDGTLVYPLPKPSHVLQATVYDLYYDYLQWSAEPTDPVVWYAARGGSNLPLECVVKPDHDAAVRLMNELDAVRAALPELPPMLPKVLKLTRYGKFLESQPDWQCTYCDYCGVSCHPDTRSEVWAELDGGWRFTRKANLDLVSAFAQREGHEALLSAL